MLPGIGRARIEVRKIKLMISRRFGVRDEGTRWSEFVLATDSLRHQDQAKLLRPSENRSFNELDRRYFRFSFSRSSHTIAHSSYSILLPLLSQLLSQGYPTPKRTRSDRLRSVFRKTCVSRTPFPALRPPRTASRAFANQFGTTCRLCQSSMTCSS